MTLLPHVMIIISTSQRATSKHIPTYIRLGLAKRRRCGKNINCKTIQNSPAAKVGLEEKPNNCKSKKMKKIKAIMRARTNEREREGERDPHTLPLGMRFCESIISAHTKLLRGTLIINERCAHRFL